MTAFNSSQLPTAITTLEQVAYWAFSTLAFLNQGRVLRVTQSDDAQLQAGVQLAVLPDGIRYAVLTAYIPLNSSYADTGAGKIWLAATEITNSAIPSAYSTN